MSSAKQLIETVLRTNNEAGGKAASSNTPKARSFINNALNELDDIVGSYDTIRDRLADIDVMEDDHIDSTTAKRFKQELSQAAIHADAARKSLEDLIDMID